MAYMILRKADVATESGRAPDRAGQAALAAWHARLGAEGLLGLNLRLEPSAEALRLRLWPGGSEVTPGPFGPAAELVAGFTVVDVPTLAAAIAWARQWPRSEGAAVLEVRETGCPGGCATVPPAPAGSGQRYVILLRSDAAGEADAIQPQPVLDALNDFNARAAQAGVLLAGDGLKSSARGARVLLGQEPPAALDGPFAEAKELVAGFWMIRADSLEAALAWARSVPYPTGPYVEVEIRRVQPPPLTAAQLRADQHLRAEQLDAALRAELALPRR